ncbi:hypothetical protein Pst134EB_001874 [Puccinia striiformis f. sp. tritici]|nr:hypothetical protein Pst134EB_001874 [Puccinia striiformis f. sp. tritici]
MMYCSKTIIIAFAVVCGASTVPGDQPDFNCNHMYYNGVCSVVNPKTHKRYSFDAKTMPANQVMHFKCPSDPTLVTHCCDRPYSSGGFTWGNCQ